MAQTHILWFLLAIMACTLRGSIAHKNHIVGGSFGWKYPENTTFYQEWAATRNFTVGDRLVFPYRTSLYNLLEVSKEDFDLCTQKNVVDRYFGGPTIIDLTNSGPRYFYCGVGMHCEAGQKLSINVSPAPIIDTVDAPAPAPDAGSKSSANSICFVAPVAGFILSVLHALLM